MCTHRRQILSLVLYTSSTGDGSLLLFLYCLICVYTHRAKDQDFHGWTIKEKKKKKKEMKGDILRLSILWTFLQMPSKASASYMYIQ